MSRFIEIYEKEQMNEGKLNKDSYMRGDRPSRDINFAGNRSRDIVSIWLNGGTAYEIKMTPEIVEKMRNAFFDDQTGKLMKKYVDKLALDVADFIEKEVTKWEKDFK